MREDQKSDCDLGGTPPSCQGWMALGLGLGPGRHMLIALIPTVHFLGPREGRRPRGGFVAHLAVRQWRRPRRAIPPYDLGLPPPPDSYSPHLALVASFIFHSNMQNR